MRAVAPDFVAGPLVSDFDTPVEVRVASAPANGMQRYVGRIGTVIGVSGQFVKVQFEGEGYYHFFEPSELTQR